ncbi:hypothetical protein CA85_49790 [Allorhodopirellula solitaria]|uniref:Uncharacterized protein n=1 Tax=Allorhodopirellula solitaria TaxID=2527987 RepID=A0A5C5WZK1_9BACT|nr:hypothetical protein CA85_49790 [Allorhodopirellula solitaria]
MDRIGFVTSILLSCFGVVLLSIGLLVKTLLPKVALIVFLAHGGRYSSDDYDLGFAFYLQQFVAICCIVWGVILSRRFLREQPASSVST